MRPRPEERDYARGLVQGSQEWLQYKCGKVGASRVADITAKLKNGTAGASRAAYMGELIAERLTGIPADSYKSAAMQWGNDHEGLARAAYQFEKLSVVECVGCILHPEISDTLASVDGLVGADGCVQFKCPMTHTHVEALLGAAIPSRYQQQMQWEMCCAERRWCDYVSFDPRLPPNMRLLILRVERDDQQIATLEKEVAAFLGDIEVRINALRDAYGHVVIRKNILADMVMGGASHDSPAW